MLLALLILSGTAAAQLNGVYTCANGNPGNAFDYGDIGVFFDDLETQGVSGPVTLDVFDDGGPFTSSASYLVGVDPVFPYLPEPIFGLSIANRLTVRAPLGERPEVTGAGIVLPPPNPQMPSTLVFLDVGFVTIEGLTFRNGVDDCIWFGGTSQTCSHIRISKCRVHDISDGAGIVVSNSGGAMGPSFVVLENNLIWNCRDGGVYADDPGIEWVVRHNTIVQTDSGLSWHGFLIWRGEPLEQFKANVIRATSSAVSGYQYCLGGGSGPGADGPFGVDVDFNTYWMEGTVLLYDTSELPVPWTFAQWQAAGYDPNGQVADPKLVNVNPGFEDLHLRHDSPCIDFVPLLTVNEDIDGDTRPVGFSRDGGADEFVPPAMAVEFNAALVPHLGALALGGVPANGVARTFTIRNLGPGHLRLDGSPLVLLAPGANCALATAVQAMPTLTLLPPNATTDFTLFIQPAGLGPMDLAVAIPCNDPARTPYSFVINGTGLPPNGPAVANAAAGSVFAGPQNGPFLFVAQPGAALNAATIELSDPDLDAVTVLSVSLLTPAPTGVIAPQTSIPIHPRILTWSGAAHAANPPGDYTWRVQFRDAVNQSVITIDATIRVADLAPTHVIAAALGGDGSQGNPYQCGFNRGDDGAASVGLCTISDANTGQAPGITAAIKAVTNPGTVTFDFTLNAGLLSVSPSGTLKVAEAGQHDYEVQVSDGANLVSIHVLIFVANQPMNFTTPSQLAPGETGAAYTATLGVTGAVGALTYTVTGGAVPAGLTLDAAGQMTGTPTQAESASFTVEAQDSTGATATRTFQLAITDPAPPPPPPPGPGSGDHGCAAGGSTTAAAFVMLALAALRRRKTAGAG